MYLMTRSQLVITNLRFLTNHHPHSVSHRQRHRHCQANLFELHDSHHRASLQSSLNSFRTSVKPISRYHSSVRSLSIQTSAIPADAHRGDPQPAKLPWRSMSWITLTTLSIGYLIGVIYPPSPISQLIINSSLKRAALSTESESSLPPDSDSDPITAAVENQLQQLPIVKELGRQPDSWFSFRPFSNLDPLKLNHSLTYSTLRGPGKFAIPPLVFINQQKTEAVIVIHVGDLMCGHDGIVHGGLLATICDEGLAALAFSNLPNHLGMTASLKIDYKKPVLANQFIVLKSWLPSDRPPKGRKVWSNGRIENMSGDVLVEAESLFIEPKLAKLINNSQIKDYIKAST